MTNGHKTKADLLAELEALDADCRGALEALYQDKVNGSFSFSKRGKKNGIPEI